MSQPGRCGLCDSDSLPLQASQWGQVCRLCLRAKSRKAVRGASVAVQAPVEPQEPPDSRDTEHGIVFGCESAQPSPDVCSAARETLAQLQRPQKPPKCRDEALREEGRQQGLQEERAAVRKEIEAVARVLSRRDEPGSSIVAALLDWIQSRNEEGG
jgi:hypothetical protein